MKRPGWSRRLRVSATLRHISVLVGGAAGAQLVVVLASPLLTRLYTPEEFGFLAVFSALLSVFMVVASLRYQIALPLARDDRAAVALIRVCVAVGVGMASMLLLGIVLFGERFGALVSAPGYAHWLYLLPPAVLIAGLFEVFRCWGVRKRTFGMIAQARVQQSVAMTLVQLGGYRFGVAALLIGQVIGRSAGLRRMYVAYRGATAGDFTDIRTQEIVEQACAFRRFPLHSTWGTLFNTLGRQLPAVFFAALADTAVAGLFALAQRVVASPLSLVGEAIGGVFMSVGAQAAKEGRLRGVVDTFGNALSRLVATPLLALVLLGPEAFAIVFGDEWAEAGLYAAWMTPWIFTVIVSTPLMAVFSITERDRELSLIQLVLAFARASALAAGWVLGSALSAIALFSLVSCFAYLSITMRLHVLAGGRAVDALRSVVSALAWASAVLSPIWLALIRNGEASLRAVGLAVMLAAAYYAWMLWRLLRHSDDIIARAPAASSPARPGSDASPTGLPLQ